MAHWRGRGDGRSSTWRMAARGAAALLLGVVVSAAPVQANPDGAAHAQADRAAHPQVDGQAHAQVDGQAHGQADGAAHAQADAQAHAQPDGPRQGHPDGAANGQNGQSHLPSDAAPGCCMRPRETIESAWRGRHTRAILIGTSAGVAVYGWRNWWQEGFRDHFATANEGWFGRTTYSGGADKLGHLYMSYAGTRLLAGLLVWDGAAPPQALRTAALYTLGAFAAIEVLDGFSKTWRFSSEDMLMNAVGVGAGVLLESHPRLDRLIDLRLRYRPSNGGFDPFGDYSGQTYLVVAKLAGLPGIGQHTGMLRYLEIAAGYGSRGFDGGRPGQGRRNVYLGVSLNLSELLGRADPGKQGRAHRIADTALEFVQIPGTVALSRHTVRP